MNLKTKLSVLIFPALLAGFAPDAAAKTTLERRLEICGSKYVYDMDSTQDVQREGFGKFPARVRVLADPQEAFIARILAVRGAKYTIDISTFIFKPGQTTYTLLHELRQAIQRGISVRLLADSLGSLSLVHSDMKSILRVRPGINPLTGKRATVDVVTFRPVVRLKSMFSWIFSNIKRKDSGTTINVNRRSHDKIFLVDREHRDLSIAIVGGRNISDSYYGVPRVDSETYEDMDVMVRDEPASTHDLSLANTLGAHHLKLLCHKGNDWLTARLSRDLGKKIERTSRELLGTPEMKALQAKWNGKILSQDLISAQVDLGTEIQNIRRSTWRAVRDPNLHADDRNAENGDSILNQAQELILHARSSIDIVSPYMYLTDDERAYLKDWVQGMPGRRVRIVSNSILTSDNLMDQTLVDTELAPGLVLGGDYRVNLLDGSHLIKRFDNDDFKIQFYELGRLDAVDFGGKSFYGKLHAKYMIIDGRIAFVGTHNGNPRSRKLDSEVGFFIHSEEFAKSLTVEFEKTIARSYHWNTEEWRQMVLRPELASKNRWIDRLHRVLNGIKALKYTL